MLKERKKKLMGMVSSARTSDSPHNEATEEDIVLPLEPI